MNQRLLAQLSLACFSHSVSFLLSEFNSVSPNHKNSTHTSPEDETGEQEDASEEKYPLNFKILSLHIQAFCFAALNKDEG